MSQETTAEIRAEMAQLANQIRAKMGRWTPEFRRAAAGMMRNHAAKAPLGCEEDAESFLALADELDGGLPNPELN